FSKLRVGNRLRFLQFLTGALARSRVHRLAAAVVLVVRVEFVNRFGDKVDRVGAVAFVVVVGPFQQRLSGVEVGDDHCIAGVSTDVRGDRGDAGSRAGGQGESREQGGEAGRLN